MGERSMPAEHRGDMCKIMQQTSVTKAQDECGPESAILLLTSLPVGGVGQPLLWVAGSLPTAWMPCAGSEVLLVHQLDALCCGAIFHFTWSLVAWA